MFAFIYLAKMRILTLLTYRFEVFIAVGSNIIMMFATVFLWKSAYIGIDTVEGLKEQQMVTYSILSVLLSTILSCNVQNIINERVRDGQVAVDLFKPISIFVCYLADDVGRVISSLLNKAFPLLIIGIVFFGVPYPRTTIVFFAFIASCGLSFAISWLLSALVGMMAFWVMELGNMGRVKDAIVGALSGRLVPLWFFPTSFITVSKYLPFQYIYQTPLGMYIGKMSLNEALTAMMIQGIWIIVLLSVCALVWNAAKKRVLTQGG